MRVKQHVTGANTGAMKTPLLVRLLLVNACLVCTALAQPAELSLPSVVATPGASLVLPINVASRLSSVAGLQFDLQYDNSALTVTATVADAARASGKTLYFADLAPNQRRFLVQGLNRNPIIDGAVIHLFVAVSPGAPAGAYTPQFSNVVATDPSGQPATLVAAPGALMIGGTQYSGSGLQPEGVLNAAGLFAGPIAPGEILILLGAGIGSASPQQPSGSPTSSVLGGTSVSFDGTLAPLLYSALNQVNAIAPYGVSGKTSTQVTITQGGMAVAGLLLPVAEASPAIFTMDGSGIGQGAILNQDQALNSPSKPALKGSVVTLFASGAGQTDPPGVDGQIASGSLPKPLLPVSVQIGGVDAKVLYAGAAPGFAAGLLQVDCMVPVASPSGPAISIVLFVGQASSQAAVTLAIR